MRNPFVMLAVAGGLLAGCADERLPPPRFSPFMPEWRMTDTKPQPGMHLEMLTALSVAEERCTGSHARMLARYYKPRMLGWRRNYFENLGFNLAFHYRRAYGERWQAVLDDQIADLRAKYEAHPDPQRFCRLAAIVARDGSGEHGGNDLWKLFSSMLRYIDPAATAGRASGAPSGG